MDKTIFLHGSWQISILTLTQPVKIGLNKKLLPKQKTIEIISFVAQAFRKTKNENPLTREIGVAS